MLTATGPILSWFEILSQESEKTIWMNFVSSFRNEEGYEHPASGLPCSCWPSETGCVELNFHMVKLSDRVASCACGLRTAVRMCFGFREKYRDLMLWSLMKLKLVYL